MSGAATAPYRVVPLDGTHDREPFACGEAALDQYLRNDALKEAALKLSATFVLVRKGRGRVLGYFSLSSLSIQAKGLPADLQDRLGRYGMVPATLIGRLAVDESLQGRGVGRALLVRALNTCLTGSATVASAVVVVDAKPDAIRFYERHGFAPFTKRPNRLFLPMDTVRKL